MLEEKRFHGDETELGFVKGPETGLMMVLLHGLAARWQDLLPLMPPLSFRNTLIAVDLRGHGSSIRVPNEYRFVDYAQDIVSFLSHEVKQPVALLGHSLGGGVAVHVAATHPELVRALILIDPGLYKHILQIDWLGEALAAWRNVAADCNSAEEIRKALGDNSAFGRRKAKDLVQLDPDTLGQALDRTAFDGFDPDSSLQAIRCPTLLIYGNTELGGIISQEDAERITSLIPDCAPEFMEDAGHAPNLSHPMQTCTLISNFLESL